MMLVNETRSNSVCQGSQIDLSAYELEVPMKIVSNVHVSRFVFQRI